MDHLHRELAPITDAAWEAIEHDARARLTTYLASRKVVDFAGPHGWAHSATDLGRITPVPGPSEGVTAAQRRVLPLLELRTEFRVPRVELDDVDRGATDIDLAGLDEAVRQIAVAENSTVFHGHLAAGIRGITEHTSHEPVALGTDPERFPTAVAQAVDVLRQSGIGGPYGLALSPSVYSTIIETTEHGGYLLLDHLRTILGGPLVWAPGVDVGVVLSLRGGDFVLDSGQDIAIGYRDHDADLVRLYLEESFSFRVLEPDASVALRTEH